MCFNRESKEPLEPEVKKKMIAQEIGLNLITAGVLYSIMFFSSANNTCYASSSSSTPWAKDTDPPDSYEDMTAFYSKIWWCFLGVTCFYWIAFLHKLSDALVILLIITQIVLSLCYGFSHKSKVCYGGYDEAKDTDGNILEKYKDSIDWRGYGLQVTGIVLLGFFMIYAVIRVTKLDGFKFQYGYLFGSGDKRGVTQCLLETYKDPKSKQMYQALKGDDPLSIIDIIGDELDKDTREKVKLARKMYENPNIALVIEESEGLLPFALPVKYKPAAQFLAKAYDDPEKVLKEMGVSDEVIEKAKKLNDNREEQKKEVLKTDDLVDEAEKSKQKK